MTLGDGGLQPVGAAAIALLASRASSVERMMSMYFMVYVSFVEGVEYTLLTMTSNGVTVDRHRDETCQYPFATVAT